MALIKIIINYQKKVLVWIVLSKAYKFTKLDEQTFLIKTVYDIIFTLYFLQKKKISMFGQLEKYESDF